MAALRDWASGRSAQPKPGRSSDRAIEVSLLSLNFLESPPFATHLFLHWHPPNPSAIDRPEYEAQRADVVKLADTQDLGSCGETRGGSSPSARTNAPRREF
jgi:hypothetical protein